MKLISWNVNGPRATHKNGQFLPFIKKEKPDTQNSYSEFVKVQFPIYFWSEIKRNMV